MKNLFSSLYVTFFCLAGIALAQDGAVKQVALTVYNSNIAIVKETRNVDLPKGSAIANIVDVAQLIDPTTVRIKFDGNIAEQNYQYDLVSMDKILQKYIDKTIQLVNDKGEFFEGKLLSAYGNQLVLKKADNGLSLLPDISKYRLAVGELPEGLITRPTLQCLLESRRAGKQDLEISYQTGGISWHAEYVAVLDKDDKSMDLNSWVSIQNNCGTTFKDASLKVIAGDINRVQPVRNYGMMEKKAYALDAVAAKPAFTENALFEYHAYELQRKATLANNETKQIELFSKENIGARKRFLYEAEPTEGETDDKVDVVISFVNSEKNNIGVPMPAGKIRLFKADGKSLEFIGEDAIDHTPLDTKVNLHLGKAFDITARTKLLNKTTISKNTQEYSYSITVKNHKTDENAVEVRMNVWGDWSVTTTSDDYKKEDAQTILFNVSVPSRSEKEIQFTVRIKS